MDGQPLTKGQNGKGKGRNFRRDRYNFILFFIVEYTRCYTYTVTHYCQSLWKSTRK